MTDSRADERTPEATKRPLLVCLVPARNAEHDLPGFLECVSGFCDAVVALDDGSTDNTWDVLDAHPLVKVLLRNPRREDYRGWDDAANRNRLIEAAEQLNPEWLISLDADERIDERDATSLREFLATDALPGCAYGFRHVPMRDDGEHFLPKYQWVYRVFSAAPGQHFPNQKLHFVPVPTSIPRYRWIRTTLRIQHYGGMTSERRLLRFHKYLEADPNRRYQEDYAHLIEAPAVEELRRWQPRPDSVPVLYASGEDEGPEASEPANDPRVPALSAIIISRNDEKIIARAVQSVVSQEVPEPFEVIVVTSGTDRTARIVRERFPSVTVVELEKPALPGEARNAGLAVARGGVITFPGSHIELLPGSLAARLRAHRRGYAMVTGLVTNGTPTPAGWASYFLDQSETLPGQAAAEFNGPPAHCSYSRLPLLEVGGFPEGVRTAEDTAVNRALVKRGYVAYRDPRVQFIHHSPCTTARRLISHHAQRGRGWGRMVVAQHRERGQMLSRAFVRDRLIEAVPIRLARIERGVQQARPDIFAEYKRVRPLVVVGAIASWVGMWQEILRPTTGKLEILLGRPVVNLLIAQGGGSKPMCLAQIDHVAGTTTLRAVSPELSVPHGDAMTPLGTLLCSPENPEHQLSDLGNSLATALNLRRADCVILSGDTPELAGNGEQRPMGRIARFIETAAVALAVVRGVSSGAIQSTLPVFSTVRAVHHVRATRRG